MAAISTAGPTPSFRRYFPWYNACYSLRRDCHGRCGCWGCYPRRFAGQTKRIVRHAENPNEEVFLKVALILRLNKEHLAHCQC